MATLLNKLVPDSPFLPRFGSCLRLLFRVALLSLSVPPCHSWFVSPLRLSLSPFSQFTFRTLALSFLVHFLSVHHCLPLGVPCPPRFVYVSLSETGRRSILPQCINCYDELSMYFTSVLSQCLSNFSLDCPLWFWLSAFGCFLCPLPSSLLYKIKKSRNTGNCQ